MPINVQSPVLQQLFQQSTVPTAANAASPYVTKGSLILFKYSFWIHDPSPLLIVTDYNPGQRMRGINLHYLTYPYVQGLITQSANNPAFSYQNIKMNPYIKSSFRTYKWSGISQIKKFDNQFVLRMINATRSFDPTQIQAIRQSIDQQLQQATTVSPAQATPEQAF